MSMDNMLEKRLVEMSKDWRKVHVVKASRRRLWRLLEERLSCKKVEQKSMREEGISEEQLPKEAMGWDR
ncbi:hypothetical protein VNO78_08275 [Psophocarpus tetragonolobus]|uniref:Uncharacterized protein n=1 Tax=Psophocarpus tetragonolobus TaxID=3891 RepID=A0AAN9SUU9_PSOTE